MAYGCERFDRCRLYVEGTSDIELSHVMLHSSLPVVKFVLLGSILRAGKRIHLIRVLHVLCSLEIRFKILNNSVSDGMNVTYLLIALSQSLID